MLNTIECPVGAGFLGFACNCAGGKCDVSTLASIELAEALADEKPEGLSIVGKTETENIGGSWIAWQASHIKERNAKRDCHV
ncbi:hypothetical protein [Candidatus Aquicultor secundus]|uniref:hypothetical protein n=1 Tax=Candidatus Aquicultor secundus TaxID=1973895 RepID=UPI00257FC542|nr:hypothetical protein [Candidatus Aquicultor secundus]